MVQVKRDGREVDHGDVFGKLEAQRAAFSRFLARELGFEGVQVEAGLVFSHPNVRVADDVARVQGVVVSPKEWAAQGEREAAEAGWIASVFRAVVVTPVSALARLVLPSAAPALPSGHHQALVALLRSLPTWDSVQLVGGKLLQGDIAGFSPSHLAPLFSSLGGREVLRGASLTVTIGRSAVINGAWTLIGFPTMAALCWKTQFSCVQNQVPITEWLEIRVPGSQDKTRIEVNDIESLKFG